MERRRHTRHERHFPLRFGDEDAAFDALTRDVSVGGLFVSTREVRPPGTRLWLELVVEPQRPLRFEVQVVRRLEAPPTRRRESGFGVRFLSAAEVLARYFPPPQGAKPAPVALSFPTAQALALAAQRGLHHGVAFAWSAEERAVGEQVALTLALPFAARTVELAARVTQVVSDGQRFGLALAVDDGSSLHALLEDTLRGEA